MFFLNKLTTLPAFRPAVCAFLISLLGMLSLIWSMHYSGLSFYELWISNINSIGPIVWILFVFGVSSFFMFILGVGLLFIK